MRILFLLLSVMLVASSAEAQVCDPAWLRNADYWDAKALLDAGVDANQIGRIPDFPEQCVGKDGL